jgi:Dual OB-containing domain
MPWVDLICLASSNKMGGRCVAGLRVDGKGWVRPIASDTDYGQLYSSHCRLKDDADPEVLDVIGVSLENYKPSPGQPENWTIGEGPWQLIARPLGPELYSVLRSALVPGPSLFGSTGRRVPETPAGEAPTSSLALVTPSKLRLFLEPDLYHRLQPRVIFELNGQSYNLPITDPAWTTRIVRKLLPLERVGHSHEIVGISKEREVLFTVSLGEAFRGYCYKLVAGIIALPTPSN